MGKKSVIGNTAKERYTGLDYSSLISIPQAEEPVKEQRKEQTVPEGYKLNPAFIEKKERRVQLVFQSSLYEKAKAKQKQLGYKSLNAYICSLLEADTDK